jgi:hypothetical protein
VKAYESGNAGEFGLPTMGCTMAPDRSLAISAIAHGPVLLPVPGRSPTNQAPTASGQNRKRRTLPRLLRDSAPYRRWRYLQRLRRTSNTVGARVLAICYLHPDLWRRYLPLRRQVPHWVSSPMFYESEFIREMSRRFYVGHIS